MKPSGGTPSGQRRRDAVRLDVGVEADEDRGEADEAVEAGDQLGHLGHLHPAGDEGAERAADDHHRREQPVVAGAAEDGGDDGERHADDAVPDGALGFLLVGEAAEGEDEEDGGRQVAGRDESEAHGAFLSSSGTWRASAG